MLVTFLLRKLIFNYINFSLLKEKNNFINVFLLFSVKGEYKLIKVFSDFSYLLLFFDFSLFLVYLKTFDNLKNKTNKTK
jgi:hypothetical protein